MTIGTKLIFWTLYVNAAALNTLVIDTDFAITWAGMGLAVFRVTFTSRASVSIGADYMDTVYGGALFLDTNFSRGRTGSGLTVLRVASAMDAGKSFLARCLGTGPLDAFSLDTYLVGRTVLVLDTGDGFDLGFTS